MKTLSAIILSLGLAVVAVPAHAAEDKPADTIERGAQLVIDGLRAFFSSIPQYAAPEVLPNGDIIIRRINPETEAPAERDEGADKGKGLKL